ncbi:MAG TPA: 2-amino-4-hydroxy-6-hydroxymethyldihydropteridine diphosphokinase [Longimicrobiales bacterium]
MGLGANLGDCRSTLTSALAALARLGRIEAISTVYRTEPVGFLQQPDFWNLVVRLATSLEPAALLAAAHGIEAAAGRTRPFRDAPRTLDIDLLLYDDLVLTQPGLRLPHPRLRERAFVLAPLAELDPELAHPATGERVRDLAAALAGAPGSRVEPLFPGAQLLPASPDTTEP